MVALIDSHREWQDNVEIIDLHDPSLYINRELSFLQFNWRVLQQALDTSLPLLERLKFIFICSSNLDEFFEVRVSGLVRRSHGHASARHNDVLSPSDALERIAELAHTLVDTHTLHARQAGSRACQADAGREHAGGACAAREAC